ncbi:dTDP-4-dehydrorhamnose reductase [Phormidesmis sp. 146-33]
MKRILLTGSDGQVGQDLQKSLKGTIAVTRNTLDLTQPDQIRQMVEQVKPDLIVNAAAYTAVDRAETEPELAYAVNAIAPGILSEMAQKVGADLIHLSTDYVFDGTQSTPYTEQDLPNPISVYGRSKLAGEQAIQQSWCSTHTSYLIIRTAWVYGAHGKSNFVKTMLRLGADRDQIRVVTDQIGTPTWSHHLAQAIANLIPKLKDNSGIYHFTNQGTASWYDFATAIFEEATALGFPLKVQSVVPITTAEYPTPAQRPAYSLLSSDKLSALLKTDPPTWRPALRQMLIELKTTAVLQVTQ